MDDKPSRLRALRARLDHPVIDADGHLIEPAESHHLVDKRIMSEADWRDFVFTYPARLHLKANPDFFKGTIVEGAAEELAA